MKMKINPRLLELKKALNPHRVSVCEAELMGFYKHSESIPPSRP